MSRWKWEEDPFTMQSEEEMWEELEEEAYLEEEKYRKRLEDNYYVDLYPKEDNNEF